MPQVARQDRSPASLYIRPEDKALLVRAVSYTHMDLTSFVLQNALQAAKAVIAEAELIALSERDSFRVSDVLEDPPPPNAKLLTAGACAADHAMTVVPWHEEPIAKRHDRDAFDCGDAALNKFLRRYARQAHDTGGAKTCLAVPDDDALRISRNLQFTRVLASVGFSRTPEVIRRGLARHDVPVFRLGRLAVDRSMQRKGLGGQLLLAAGRRCLRASQEVGRRGIANRCAKNQAVASWYQSRVAASG